MDAVEGDDGENDVDADVVVDGEDEGDEDEDEVPVAVEVDSVVLWVVVDDESALLNLLSEFP